MSVKREKGIRNLIEVVDATIKVTSTEEGNIKRTSIVIPRTVINPSEPLTSCNNRGHASIDILLPDNTQLMRLNFYFRDKEWADIDVIWKRPNAEVKLMAWKEGTPVIDTLVPEGISLVAVNMNWKKQ